MDAGKQSNTRFPIPPQQQAIRNQCLPPSGTFVEFPTDDVETSMPVRFENIVRQFPNRLAVKTNECELSNDDLNQRTNRLAHYPVSEHHMVHQPVGIFVDQRDELVVAHLAVLKSRNCLFDLDLAADETQSSARDLLGGEPAVIHVNQFRPSSCENNPKDIGGNNKFLKLGWHSLGVRGIISRVIEKCDLKLSVMTLFDSPTIAEMAAFVAQDEIQGTDPVDSERIVI